MKNNTFKILIGLFALMLSIAVVNGQDDPKIKEIRIQLIRLSEYSNNYDRYRQLPKEKYGEQIVKFEKLYRDQIKKIKHGPDRELYTQYLKTATGADSLKYKDKHAVPYVYIYSILTQRTDRMPTLLEFYKVVNYSLFTMDMEELIPPRDIPFLRYKEW